MHQLRCEVSERLIHDCSTRAITGPGASKWGIGEAATASREDTSGSATSGVAVSWLATSGSAGNMTKTENITAAAPNATSQTNTGSSSIQGD